MQDMMGYVDDWPEDTTTSHNNASCQLHILEELRSAGEELRQTSRSNEVMAWLKLEQFRDVVDLCTATCLQECSVHRCTRRYFPVAIVTCTGWLSTVSTSVMRTMSHRGDSQRRQESF